MDTTVLGRGSSEMSGDTVGSLSFQKKINSWGEQENDLHVLFFFFFATHVRKSCGS